MRELVGVSYVPLVGLAQDLRYAYYHLTNVLYVTPSGSDLTQSGHQEVRYTFAGGSSIRQLWTTDQPGELFLLLLDSGVYTLQRSEDYGASWAVVHTFQTDSYLLERGFCIGYPNGVRTFAYAEYTVSSGNPSLVIATSTDGVTWSTRWTLAGGMGGGTRQIRHFHCIVWDPWEACFWISSGDASAHSMIVKWDGIAALPDNTALADLAAAGFTLLTGGQAYRAVDILATREAIYWGSDTTSTTTGTVAGDKGIWRANKALTAHERVDLGDARYDPVAGALNRSTMWTGIFLPDEPGGGTGHLLFSTYMNTAAAGLQFESFFLCHTDNAGPGGWVEAGRVYIRSGEVNVVRAMYAHDGIVSYSFTRGAGKGVTGETALMRLGVRDFIPDRRLPDTVGDGGMTWVRHHVPPMHPLHFVSPTGDDSNDGATPARPWRSFAKAMAASTAPITYGAGVVFAEGLYDIADTLTLNWFNYPVGSGYEGESGHLVWLLGPGRDLAHVHARSTALTSSHLLEISNSNGELMVDSMRIDSAHENAGARLFYLNAANARVHSRDAELGGDDYRASALRSGASVANRYQHFRSKLANGVDAGGTTAVAQLSGALGEIFEAHACILSGYQGAVITTNGPGLELYSCLIRDFFNFGVSTIAGNTTGRFWLLGCLFVDSGTGTGTSYNSTNAVGLDRRLISNAYTVLPLQVSDQGVNGQRLIVAADEFVGGDPLAGTKAGSLLIEAACGVMTNFDFRRRRFRNPQTIGHLEHAPGERGAAVTRI